MAFNPGLNKIPSLGSGPTNARHLGPAMNKKVQGAKSMSPEMRKWVEANRSKLKDPTDAQKALFKKYDALKKAGNLPSLSGVKSKPAEVAKKLTKKAKTTPPKAKTSPTKPTERKLETRGKTNATMPSNPAGQRQQRAGSATRGGAMPSNPAGQRQRTEGKPTRGANVPDNPKLKTARDIVNKHKGGQRSKSNRKPNSTVANIIERFSKGTKRAAQKTYDTLIDYRRKKGNKK